MPGSRVGTATYTPTPATTQETLNGGADALLAMPATTPEIAATERADAARMVRRLANRHGCPGRCHQPDHDVDVEHAAEILDILGLATPRVLGLDLSLASTGIASSRGWCDTIQPSKKQRGLPRLRYLVDQVREYARDAGYTLAVIEGPSYGHAGQQGHDELAALRWMVRDVLDRLGVPAAVAPPSSVKLWAAGKGNASKGDVLSAMRDRYPSADINGSDEADALALASLGAAWAADVPLTPVQQRAIAGVDWSGVPR